jgi:hypothetical protein
MKHCFNCNRLDHSVCLSGLRNVWHIPFVNLHNTRPSPLFHPSSTITMLHSIHAINPAPLNAIMPRLQQMADDPAFPERRRHRFNEDDPPPPYSSGSTTELPTPTPFPPVADNDVDVDELLRKPLNDEEINWFGGKVRYYRPHHRYYDEFSQERRRIDREWGRRDESFKRVYRGPDLTGLSGQQRLRIMIRHSIKKRWERLGVWNPEWRIPTYIDGGHTDTAGNWAWKWDREQSYTGREDDYQRYEMRMVSWPSREEELPDERAVRLHLERQGVWTETHGPQPLETDRLGYYTRYRVLIRYRCKIDIVS